MYEYLFKYLKTIIKDSSVLIIGEVLPKELIFFKDNDLSLVWDDIEFLMKIKSDFPNFELNQSIYFVKRKFDFIVTFENYDINYRNFLKETGVLLKVAFIDNEIVYHKLLLDSFCGNFLFNEKINLYKKEIGLAIYNEDVAKLETFRTFKEVPSVLIDFCSDIELDLENSIVLS